MAVLCSRCRGDSDAADEQEVTCVMLEGNGCSACVERAAIRDKIKRLEEELIKLEAKYHALGTTMNAIHDPFIHKFPPEIGSYIFHLGLPQLNLEPIFPERDRTVFFRVLRLGAVCRKWRQLAWATPNLWEILSIVPPLERMHNVARSWPGLINEWLGRSGELPLTISFAYNQNEFDDPEEFDGALERIIEVLTLHSSRWRNLRLYVDPRTLERLSGSMHLSQLLRLHILVYAAEPSSLSTQKIVMKSRPFPTFLRLENLSPKSIDIGWNNITTASLSMLTTDECAEVFRRAPALEHFHLDEFPYSDGSIAHVNSFIIHPRIRSLNLPIEARDFLNMINVPFLEEWTQHVNGDTFLVTAMVSLLQRSSCCLKILNLQDITPSQNQLVTLFQATPFLERLEMHFRRHNVAVYDILVRIFDSPPDQYSSHDSFLPRVQFLEFRGPWRVAPFSWDRIPDLYRLGHRCSLTLKSVINASETSDETAMELLKLVDHEGAKFLISDIGGGNFLGNLRKRIGREGR